MPRVLIWMLLSLLPFNALAETPEKRGLEIAREADRRDQGFGNSTVELEMILKNSQGQTSNRELRMLTLEVPEETAGDKALIIFDRPGDIRGTALLTYTRITEPDDQWLYLPALKRTKRISSRNKSGPFVGSEFAYEDLASQELAKYTYRFVGEELCDNVACYKMERFPIYEGSCYSRQMTWIDKEAYRLRKIVSYDRKGSLLKTLSFKDYRQYLGTYWRAHDLTMENDQTGKSTRLLAKSYQFRTALNEADFERGALGRLR
ncbi:outer membrane lipoprotein-sorting protein [Desulfuromonas sp.]|uniref:outer membrane lipoprotein-sorting protein n=1 Tax=Desulfuromonas sp. TaxID=892 RepID=UPI0025C0C771|nr:outer membrane lipoprotein-sorting protein [Desulfuromonas sp.]